jgi:F420-0:gamma-glutamyl ligase
VSCDERVVLSALPGLPRIERGDALGPLLCEALRRAAIEPRAGDVLVVTSKVICMQK